MHALYFVKLKKAEDAINEVQQLLDSNGFAGEGGFYSRSKADWFMIGGRWSGLMTQYTPEYKEAMEQTKILLKKEIKKTPEILSYLHINPHCIENEAKRKAIDIIFMKKTGQPYFRDTYRSGAYSDDVFQITKENLAILKKDCGDCEVAVVDEEGSIDEEIMAEELSEENIGEYMVIVDYHS